VTPFYILTTRFGPASGAPWREYVAWSGLTHLRELVTLDGTLCPPVLDEVKDAYWPHIVNEDFLLGYFTDLGVLLSLAEVTEARNLLCVFRNPEAHPAAPVSDALHFEFVGYDLVELETGISALSNCGGFAQAFAKAELNAVGLIGTHTRAAEVQSALATLYPDEPHADCDLWAVFRAADL